jgi:hypothetical protein
VIRSCARGSALKCRATSIFCRYTLVDNNRFCRLNLRRACSPSAQKKRSIVRQRATPGAAACLDQRALYAPLALCAAEMRIMSFITPGARARDPRATGRTNRAAGRGSGPRSAL